MNKIVLNEVKKAYADCLQPLTEYAMRQRNLNFTASEWTNKEDTLAILTDCLPMGYNNFESKLIEQFPDDAMFKIAREFSVCLYVKKEAQPLPGQEQMIADELSYENGEFRYWWD